MLGRALSLATVMLLIGCLAAERTLAQENLEAGKTPSQIFAGTCNACHKSPRGLLKTVPPGSLPSFLRQHYTTSPNMAGVLSSYLISNGATERPPKEAGKDAKQEAKQDAKGPSDQSERSGRKQRPVTASQEPKPEPSARPDEGEVPAQAAVDRGPDGRKSSGKQKFSKRGRPGAEEPPKADASPSGETPKETAKEEDKPEAPKPPGEAPSQSATAEPTGEAPSMTRPDPVPPVTPAPPTAAPVTAAPVTAAPAVPPPLSPAAVSAAVAGTNTQTPAVPLPSQPAPAPASAVTAAAPSLPPVAPAGPPAPPISQ